MPGPLSASDRRAVEVTMRLLRADADERLRNLSRHHDRAAERKVIRARVQAAHACKALLAECAQKDPPEPAVQPAGTSP